MLNLQRDLFAFHQKMNLEVNGYPQIPDEKTKALRSKLISEEAKEVSEALGKDDLQGVAKELIDLIYVTVGTAISYGINLSPIWDAVHESNMKKDSGLKNEDGKVLKPKGWKAPNLAFQIAQQITTGQPRVEG